MKSTEGVDGFCVTIVKASSNKNSAFIPLVHLVVTRTEAVEIATNTLNRYSAGEYSVIVSGKDSEGELNQVGKRTESGIVWEEVEPEIECGEMTTPDPKARAKGSIRVDGIEWPFDQPPSCVVITSHSIARRREPILRARYSCGVTWEFLGRSEISRRDEVLVSLEWMLKLDSTLAELGNMPPGSEAQRDLPDSPWTFRKL